MSSATFCLTRNGPTFEVPKSDVRAIHLHLMLEAHSRRSPAVKTTETFLRRVLEREEVSRRPDLLSDAMHAPLARAIDQVRAPLSDGTRELRRHLADSPALTR